MDFRRETKLIKNCRRPVRTAAETYRLTKVIFLQEFVWLGAGLLVAFPSPLEQCSSPVGVSLIDLAKGLPLGNLLELCSMG